MGVLSAGSDTDYNMTSEMPKAFRFRDDLRQSPAVCLKMTDHLARAIRLISGFVCGLARAVCMLKHL